LYVYSIVDALASLGPAEAFTFGRPYTRGWGTLVHVVTLLT
jgi:hypothetical protein